MEHERHCAVQAQRQRSQRLNLGGSQRRLDRQSAQVKPRGQRRHRQHDAAHRGAHRAAPRRAPFRPTLRKPHAAVGEAETGRRRRNDARRSGDHLEELPEQDVEPGSVGECV